MMTGCKIKKIRGDITGRLTEILMKDVITYDELQELQSTYELQYRGKYGIYDRYKLYYPSGDYKYLNVEY